MIILVRHGQSTYNRDHIIAGNADIPLTDTGRDQTKAAAQELAGLRVNHAFVSPLVRAQETLDIILKELRQEPPVTVVPELIERNLGVLTGNPESDYSPEDWKPWYTWEGAPEGGESYHDMHDRTIPWFTSAVIPYASEENVLVVSHNAIMKVLRQFLEKVDPDAVGDLETPNSGAYWYEVAADGSATLLKSP